MLKSRCWTEGQIHWTCLYVFWPIKDHQHTDTQRSPDLFADGMKGEIWKTGVLIEVHVHLIDGMFGPDKD